jgi:hypothetical protein
VTCNICWKPECEVIATGGDAYRHRHEIDVPRKQQRDGLNFWQVRALWEIESEHHREAARAFGAARGWKLSRRPFAVETLAQRKCRGEDDGLLPRSAWDHPYFYRIGRRAAAVAAHLYDGEEHAAGWAARVGLVASFPPEPSWWNYPYTTLVLYEPAEAANVVELAGWRR